MTRLLRVALCLALGLLAGWWALALVAALVHGASGAGHARRVERAIAEAREGTA